MSENPSASSWLISTALSRQVGNGSDQDLRAGWGELSPALAAMLPKIEPPQEQLDEEAEWAELEKTALSGEQLDALAEHFRSTGQASA